MANFTVNDLRNKITILQEIVSRDAELNVIKAYRPLATVWASVQVKQSRWTQTQVGERASLTYNVAIRYDKRLLPAICFVQYNGSVLEPVTAPYNDRNMFIMFEAREAVGLPVYSEKG